MMDFSFYTFDQLDAATLYEIIAHRMEVFVLGQGNIYRDDFWDVWQNRFDKFRDREWARRGECADCSMFRYCQGGGMHLRGDDGELLCCHYHRL